VQNLRVNRAGRERGAAAVGYAVMVAIIALLLVAGVWMLSEQLGDTFSGGAECVASPRDCEGAGGGGGGGPGGGGGGGTSTTNPGTTAPAGTTTTT
jgi:Flp pilus assembly pilin Flp